MNTKQRDRIFEVVKAIRDILDEYKREVKKLEEDKEFLEAKCEQLTEQNRKLTNKLKENK